MKATVKQLELIESQNIGCIRKWPSKRARIWFEGFIENATKQLNIDAIIVVGSAIRKVSHIADIDIIVIYSNIKPSFNKPPIDVDIRAYDRAMASKLLSKGHDLLGWAVRLGCIIFERNHYWTMLRSFWINHLKFPSANEAIERAAKANKLYLDLSAAGDIDAANEMYITMLTHLARAHLIKSGIFPASRPELVKQLREISEIDLSDKLTDALERRWKEQSINADIEGGSTDPTV